MEIKNILILAPLINEPQQPSLVSKIGRAALLSYVFVGYCGLNSSLKEMVNLLKLMINRGMINGQRFLSEASIERMENPSTTLAAKAGLKFGYGLGIYHTEYAGFVFHGHGGKTAGYLARFDYLLENASGTR